MSGESVVLVATRTFAIAQSRLPLIEAILGSGRRCIVIAQPDHALERVQRAGAEVRTVRFERSRPVGRCDAAALRTIAHAVRRDRVAMIHSFHLKPIIVSAMAARRRVASVATVTGVGSSIDRLARPPLRNAVRSALGNVDALIFQNPDDRERFESIGWIGDGRGHLIKGSGVDTARFRPPDDAPRARRVLFAGRLLWSKGFGEFVEAARTLREVDPSLRFLVAGELDDSHPDAVPASFVDNAVRSGVIHYLGFVGDMASLLASTSLLVLPSYYPEGLPRVGLEAAATGVPVIAADSTGTREAVVDGITGRLVPSRSSDAIVEAISHILSRPSEWSALSHGARQWAVDHHDIEAITRAQLAVYASVGVAVGDS